MYFWMTGSRSPECSSKMETQRNSSVHIKIGLKINDEKADFI